MTSQEDMVIGYLAGLASGSPILPVCHYSQSAAFKHGWLNGRDDRISKPHETADVLRRRAHMIEGMA